MKQIFLETYKLLTLACTKLVDVIKRTGHNTVCYVSFLP